ncbi:MAG TPA: PilT/PilU family type 4a pilus ATPase, partial [Actinomycetes bacterium]|nr:PilT/PilU family type 4a pilus ATPase [Actinomycetes bacterium]
MHEARRGGGAEVTSLVAWLEALVDVKGSDLHLKVGSPPRMRVDGRLVVIEGSILTPEMAEGLLREVIRPELYDEFQRSNEADFAYSLSGVGRFRVNAFRQRGSVGMVLRRVQAGAMSIGELGLPPVIARLAEHPRGLVLVTGPTGSGKTTTLAAMIDHVNANNAVHIVTIEDPIEVLHADKLGMVSQREVRVDTEDFTIAMRAAMRQDPDVILVGEIRDAETLKTALAAAETGHLVLSTLHTADAAETVNRCIGLFPPYQQRQVRLSLATALRGIVGQRLVRRTGDGGRVAVLEVMVNTGRTAEAIADAERTGDLTSIMAESGFYGMQTFDQHLIALYRDGVIELEDALGVASSPH